MRIHIYILLILLIAISCSVESENSNFSKKQQALFIETARYLDSSDTTAIFCLKFIITNLPYQFSVEGTLISAYKDSIVKYKDDALAMEMALTSLSRSAQNFSADLPDDVDFISGKYLAENIQLALSSFRNTPWHDEISFDIFCKYVLPYKVNREIFEDWRNTEPRGYEISNTNDLKTIFRTARELHSQMYEKKKDFKIFDLGLPELPFSATKQLLIGTCHELSTYGTYVMRANSIPTAIDFTPQYANRSGGHEWNAIILSADSCLGFDVTVDSLGYNEFWDPETRFAKVFRKTFHKVETNHFSQVGFSAHLPNYFNDPKIEDVTRMYCNTKRIEIPLIKKTTSEHVYLSVFDNRKWLPIAWGKIKDRFAVYEDIGAEAAYLPEIITGDERKPLNYPFTISSNGEIHLLKPDKQNLITLTLTRKFPLTARIKLYISRMVGGTFQGADNANFENPENLYKIKSLDGARFNEIEISNKRKFRYVRYLSPNNGYCNLAEMAFYNNISDVVLKGMALGTDEVFQNDSSVAKSKVFDGNPLTYFDAKEPDSAWVGLDLGVPTSISKIRFLARNDLNGIYPENIYELFYWDNNWISLGQQTTKGSELVYTDVPSNSLFLLKNLTEGKEERIFTYHDNEQMWW